MINNIPPRKAGGIVITVTLELDTNGILQVYAKIDGMDTPIKTEINYDITCSAQIRENDNFSFLRNKYISSA